jgi:hypothetical protein
MRGQEANYLAGQLQGGHPSVEVDPIEALQIQTHVPIEDVVDGDHAGRHRGASGERRRTTPPACSHRTATSPAKPSTTSAVRGEASLALHADPELVLPNNDTQVINDDKE